MDNNDELGYVKKNSRARVIYLIQTYCSGSQQEFANKTGLNKGTVSQYVNGKKTPTSIAAQAIGKVFKVSPAWVMGFSFPSGLLDSSYQDPKDDEVPQLLKEEFFMSSEKEKLIDYDENIEYKDIIDKPDEVLRDRPNPYDLSPYELGHYVTDRMRDSKKFYKLVQTAADLNSKDYTSAIEFLEYLLFKRSKQKGPNP